MEPRAITGVIKVNDTHMCHGQSVVAFFLGIKSLIPPLINRNPGLMGPYFHPDPDLG